MGVSLGDQTRKSLPGGNFPGGRFPDTLKFIEYCSMYGATTRISSLGIFKTNSFRDIQTVHLRIINCFLSMFPYHNKF